MTKQFDTLLWIGAGSAEQPAHALQTAKHVVLVDANEATCAELTQRFAKQKSSKVLHALVSDTASKHNWYSYNLSELSASMPATAELTQLFPGLKLLETSSMPSMPLPKLLEDIGILGTNNALIIDCPASANALMHSLLQLPEVPFTQIQLVASAKPLYKSMATQADLQNLLEQHGFELQVIDSSDPDFPLLQFYRNPLWVAVAQTKQQLEQAKQEVKEIQAELMKEQEQHQVTKNQFAEVQSWFQSRKKQVEELKSAASLQLDQIKSLNNENIQLKKLISDCEKVAEVKSLQLNEVYSCYQTLIRNKLSVEHEFEKQVNNLQEEIFSLKVKLKDKDIELESLFSSEDLMRCITEKSQSILEAKKISSSSNFSQLLGQCDAVLIEYIKLREQLIQGHLNKA
ncbi:MAG: hypothetical protein LAT66_07180 [Alkalimonas sp.]|nr:hypothetical protein [Alkalimonas sp.]